MECGHIDKNVKFGKRFLSITLYSTYVLPHQLIDNSQSHVSYISQESQFVITVRQQNCGKLCCQLCLSVCLFMGRSPCDHCPDLFKLVHIFKNFWRTYAFVGRLIPRFVHLETPNPTLAPIHLP